jgi:hypothetical protein
MSEEREEYGDYSVDDEDQPGAEDTLDDQELDDPLDAGYSPVEGYRTDYGDTPWEEEHRESIDQRLRQEVPDADPYAEDDEPDEDDTRREVGDRRAGRLVEPDEGVREDDEKDLLADDVGIDGAGASAEEAAVHVIDEDDLDDDL